MLVELHILGYINQLFTKIIFFGFIIVIVKNWFIVKVIQAAKKKSTKYDIDK